MKVIVDVSTIPISIKETGELKDWVKHYKKEYGVDIVPLDFSKKNTQGNTPFQPLPIG